MVRRLTAWVPQPLLPALLAGLAAAACLLIAPVAASELPKADPALKLIPADASVYYSSLRNREQIEAIAKSQVWKRLTSMPVIQMALGLYQTQADQLPDSPPAKIQKVLKDPQVIELLDFLADMFSDDVFVYSDQSLVGFVDLVQDLQRTNQYSGVVAAIAAGQGESNPNQLQARMILAALARNADRLKVPNVIAGFKLANPQAAVIQLAKLELILGAGASQVPPLAGSVRRTKVGNADYLTVSLHGKMVPWEQLPLEGLKKFEAKPGDLDKVVAKLKEMTLVLALGVREDFLLVSIGPTTDCLAHLGSGTLLADVPEMKVLEKFAGERVTNLGYASQSLRATTGTTKEDIDALNVLIDQVLPLSKLNKDQQEQIRNDATDLIKDIKTLIPNAGATSGVCFLNDRGIECYLYDWSEHPQADGSKPLGLLEHVGGDPLLAIVARGKPAPEQYSMFVKWVTVGWRYFQTYGLPALDAVHREKVSELLTRLGPPLGRLNEASRLMLLPALADSQCALVIDAKLASKQFIASVPATKDTMPMAEPAILLGVSDATLMRQGMKEYWQVLQEVLDAVHGVFPDAPKVTLPEPHIEKTKLGELFVFALPAEWGVDEKISPVVGLSDSVLVLTASKDHAERLLESKSLSIGGLLADAAAPAAMAAFVNWVGILDAATPWINLAVEQIVKEQSAKGQMDKNQLAMIQAQVKTVLDILRAMHNITSRSYLDQGAMVSHTLIQIHDID